MTDSIFTAAPFFLLRTAISPMEEYERLITSENWIETILELFDANELLRESILIASPTLYQSLQQKPIKDPEKVATSLFNYALRMSSRATPFGLFSFVTTGIWGQHTDISFEYNQLIKRARVDMEWVYTYISKLYENKSTFSTLSVRTNPLIQMNNERFSLQYIRYGKKTDEPLPKAISIRNNKLTQSILNLAKVPITVSDLCDKLTITLSNCDRKKIEDVIYDLFLQQILLPGILPSLLSSLDENYFSSSHLGIEQIIKKINLYNKFPIGRGEKILQELQEDMKSLANCSNYLQIDTSYNGAPCILSQEISKQAAEAASILWKISAPLFHFERLSNYHSKYIEKYGIHRTVPLLEMLSEEKGLGSFLNADMSNPKPGNPSFVLNWERWLMKEWQECLYGNKNEIIVNDEIITSFFEENLPNPNHAPLSFDLFFKVLTRSQQEIDKEEFSLLFIQPTFLGGSTWGRFLDLLGDDSINRLKDFYQSEEKLEPETIFVELSYWPKAARSANVAIQPCFRNYRLDLEAKAHSPTSLSLEDIYVGATPNNFYLTLKEGKKDLVFRMGNLLTSEIAPEAIQFLQEVSESKSTFIRPFFWGKIKADAIFLPRVRFKKTILSPALWQCHAQSYSKKKKEEIIPMFISWADQWKLPDCFFLVKFDHQLLMDRNHPAHLQEIAHKLQNGESLQFIEAPNSSWVTSEKGNHFSEIVIPFLKNPDYGNMRKDYVPIAYQSVSFEKRWMMPGSEWHAFKLYLAEDGMDSFLIRHLDPFIEKLLQIKQISRWFFVRYNDPDPHLRVRIKLQPEKNFQALFNEMAQQWMKDSLIKNIVIVSYEREVERYGGIHLINAAEEVFCANTQAIILCLKAFLNKTLEFDEITFHIISVLCFLKNFNLDYQQAMELLCSGKHHQNALKDYRLYKKPLLSLVQELECSRPSHHGINLMKEIFSACKDSQEKFYNKSVEHISSEALFSIYDSLLHMHCNRLGCNNTAELRVRAYAHHTLKHLQHPSLMVQS